MKRRTFLLSGALTAAPSKSGGYAPILSAQAYVFNQFYARQSLNADDYAEKTFETFHRAGYRTLELIAGVFDPQRADARADLLKRLGIQVPVVYQGGRFHTAEDAARSEAAILGVADRLQPLLSLRGFNVNPDPKPKRESKTDAELVTQSAALNRLGAELKKRGIRLMVHQHDPEMRENAREWRHWLNNTDSANVGVCLDTHWVYRGGQNVMELLKLSLPRLESIHLRNSKAGVWQEELNDGDIDYRSVAKVLMEHGYRGYLVVELAWDRETPITRGLEENLIRSRQYAERVFQIG